MMKHPTDQRMATREAAEYLGVKPSTLETWRCNKRYNLPYVRIGRLIRYRQSDLDKWIESRSVGGCVMMEHFSDQAQKTA